MNTAEDWSDLTKLGTILKWLGVMSKGGGRKSKIRRLHPLSIFVVVILLIVVGIPTYLIQIFSLFKDIHKNVTVWW